MKLTRKQVKAYLDVLSNDDYRPALCRAAISLKDGKPYLAATNSYILAALKLDDSYSELVGKCVLREELVKWYKLADGKSVLTDDVLKDMLVDNAEKFPGWDALVPKSTTATESIGFHPKYAVALCAVADQDLNWKLNGTTGPMLAETSRGIYMLMPSRAS